jgi:hypothetical protein
LTEADGYGKFATEQDAHAALERALSNIDMLAV